MKTCSRCGVQKPLDDFSLRADRPGTRRNICRACQREYARAHYAANREYYVAKSHRTLTKPLGTLERYVDYLLEHPCVDCGETDVRVLQFDHRDPTQKSALVSRMVAEAHAWESVLVEIAKCDVRCANCHRRRTAAQFNWRRLLGEPPLAYN